MKKPIIILMTLLSVTFFVSCSDDSEASNEITIKLGAKDLTDKGYFDGSLYYKITSNNPREVSVNKSDKQLISIEIPARIMIEENDYECTSIAKEAFVSSRDLIDMTIPNTMKLVGRHAFYFCTKLTTIHCKGTTPPELTLDAFTDNTYSTATLYVPSGASSTYESSYWVFFENILEE